MSSQNLDFGRRGNIITDLFQGKKAKLCFVTLWGSLFVVTKLSTHLTRGYL